MSKENKYPILVQLSNTYKVLAYIVGVLAFIFSTLQIMKSFEDLPFNEALTNFFIIGLVGGFLAISLYALAEGIKLFIDIEKNTRK